MAEMSNHPFVSSASARTSSVSRSSESSAAYLSDPMMKMKWFHPFLTRHSAECMLIDNAPEGSYLLRPSATGGKDQYTLSVKFSQSVQHMKVRRLPDNRYQFGRSFFENVNALKKHFELERPVVGGESGITVVLSYPYSREVDEQHLYTEVHHHAVTRMINNAVVEESDSDSYDLPASDSSPEVDSLHRRLQQITPVASREGYLTKLGKIKKNWKVRWFVLRNTTLSYYKTKQSPKPIRSINVLRGISADYDPSFGKDFGFRLVMPERTFFFFANNEEDCSQWVDLLKATIQNRDRPQVSDDSTQC